MPELPEVEVTRRGIDEPLRGARVLSARLGKPLRWPLGCPPEALVGSLVGPVLRRGKYLWVPLYGAGGLLMHLGMSGSLALCGGDGGGNNSNSNSNSTSGTLPPGPHDHFDLVTSHGTLRLTDPRRFGAVVWSPAIDVGPAAKLLAPLGHEPFDPALTPALFHAGLRQRRAPVKTVLLEGSLVVGAGNIYACEALFHAGIHPRLRAESISRPRAERLLAALRETLARALDVGGSTLRDFRDVHGLSGEFQAETRVYGRAGLPCLRCGGAVRRVVQNQRSTFFCPGCQTR